MSGHVAPDEMWSMEPVLAELRENPATAQFFHRLTAYLLLGVGGVDGVEVPRSTGRCSPLFGASWCWRRPCSALSTLMHAAPLDLSLTHQALGVIVLHGRNAAGVDDETE